MFLDKNDADLMTVVFDPTDDDIALLGEDAAWDPDPDQEEEEENASWRQKRLAGRTRRDDRQLAWER